MRSSMMACGFLLGVLCCWTPSLALAQPASPPPALTIRGRVTDAESRVPVDLAEVVVVGTTRRTYTDEKGQFVLEGVAPGPCTLSVTRMGYAPLRRELVAAEGSAALELRLTHTAIPLQEVTVTPGSFSFMGQGVGVRQTMTREDVDAVPQIGDDIFRAVNRLPGLASNDYSAHFGIRGGRHDETLILLDGLELYEPYHLKDFNEGAISIIDANTIDGVQLMTGGFPANYGNKRSGVFNIESRVPEPNKTQFDVGVSLLNSHALAMGSFGQGKGSWLAFGRLGYLGPMFAFIDQADLPKPQYEDVFAKTSYKLSSTQELSLDILSAGDKYLYDIPATTGFLDTISTREIADNTFSNSYAWSTLKSSFGTNLSARTMFSGGLVKRDRNGSEKDILKVAPFYAVSNQRKYTTFGAAQDWTLGLSGRDIVTFGADVRQMHNNDRNRQVVYQDPDDPEPPPPGEFPILTNTTFDASGTRFGGYLSNRWRIVRPLVLETGVRYDHASWTGDKDWSPRVSAAYELGHGMNARLGWGYYRQMQNIDEVAALNNNTTFYPSELSEQWTASWDRVGSKGSQLRIEGYFKRGTHLRPVFRNWKGAVDAFPEPNEDRILVTPHETTTKGVEIYFDRPVSKSLTARASYSYAIADEDVVSIVNVNSSDLLTYDLSHPGPQDQRHAANADLTWRVGAYVLNGSFAYHSGWPATHEHLVPAFNDNGDPDSRVLPEKLYAERLPDYMRFDIRTSRKWATHAGDFGVSLEVINLTNHTNVFGYDYYKYKNGAGQVVLGRGDEVWFTIMPSVGVTWNYSF